MKLRPSVAAFADAMERKLRTKDKSRGVRGWREMDLFSLYRALFHEQYELSQAIRFECPIDEIADECCDVANYAMMIYDLVMSGERP